MKIEDPEKVYTIILPSLSYEVNIVIFPNVSIYIYIFISIYIYIFIFIYTIHPTCRILSIFPTLFSSCLFNLPNVNQRNPIRNVRSWEIRIDTLVGRTRQRDICKTREEKVDANQATCTESKQAESLGDFHVWFGNTRESSQRCKGSSVVLRGSEKPGTEIEMLTNMIKYVWKWGINIHSPT